jgi:hypothetical protein
MTLLSLSFGETDNSDWLVFETSMCIDTETRCLGYCQKSLFRAVFSQGTTVEGKIDVGFILCGDIAVCGDSVWGSSRWDVQVLGVEDVNQLPSRQAGAGFNTA